MRKFGQQNKRMESSTFSALFALPTITIPHNSSLLQQWLARQFYTPFMVEAYDLHCQLITHLQAQLCHIPHL